MTLKLGSQGKSNLTDIVSYASNAQEQFFLFSLELLHFGSMLSVEPIHFCSIFSVEPICLCLEGEDILLVLPIFAGRAIFFGSPRLAAVEDIGLHGLQLIVN